MPGKSRHGKGKYSFQGKKKKGRPGHFPVSAQRPVVAQVHEPVSTPQESIPAAVSVPAAEAKQAKLRYPQMASELRMIGILAVVMVVILVVLYFALS